MANVDDPLQDEEVEADFDDHKSETSSVTSGGSSSMNDSSSQIEEDNKAKVSKKQVKEVR
jgi:hypothetical protein